MNGIKTNKACRFLSSALSLRECLPNIFVILQEEKGRIHEANAIKEPERKKAKRNPVFVSSTETEIIIIIITGPKTKSSEICQKTKTFDQSLVLHTITKARTFHRYHLIRIE
jgi:hypothetical protein